MGIYPDVNELQKVRGFYFNKRPQRKTAEGNGKPPLKKAPYWGYIVSDVTCILRMITPEVVDGRRLIAQTSHFLCVKH